MPRFALACILLLLCGLSLPASAQDANKPFALPVAGPPGPNTWLFGQAYGNTTGAYLRGDEWYRAGQRLHFGIDLSMACGTTLVSIGDGEIVAVDDLSFGSAPHNLLIRHDAGYVSLYGHLLERPPLTVGQRVVRGQDVGLSGDPDLTCDSRPHLHLEIRSLDYRTTYNPAALIDAPWDTLALIGPFSYPLFQQDLDNARRWMTHADQPDVAFGGVPLNNYAATYPTVEMYISPANPPVGTVEAAPIGDEPWALRRVAFDGCCPGARWSPTDPDLLYLIDGAPGQRAAIYEWDVVLGAPTGMATTAPPPLTSPDGTLTVSSNGTLTTIRRLADGAEWQVDTGNAIPALSPDNALLMWQQNETGDDAPTTLWISGVDGANAAPIASAPGLNARWLDATRLLVWQRMDATTALYIYDTTRGETVTLGAWEWLRGLSLAPGGGRLMFYLFHQPDPAASGIYTIETRAGAQAEHLPWFGGWRWRDADSVFYVPQEVDQPSHQLRVYDLASGDDIALTDPATQPFAIAEGDWSVSADGMRAAFWNALDHTVWVAEG
ncbi:MAG: M23 family metallopeptidase [Anaerolineae bacterium]|nr:M23 family metallopeptidase [Anaerolineae bacterium]